MGKQLINIVACAAIGLASAAGVARADSPDEQFVALLSADGIDGDHEQLILVGREVCPWQNKKNGRRLGVGTNPYHAMGVKITKSLQAQGLSPDQMNHFVRDAVQAYCPEMIPG